MKGVKGKKKKALPAPPEGCALCQDWHAPGKHRYWVWQIGEGDRPVARVQVFAETKDAKGRARDVAIESRHDTGVSRGYDPTVKGFSIVARYRAGTGERVI